MNLARDMLTDDTYRLVLQKLRSPSQDVPDATRALMVLAADMLEEEIIYSGKQSVAVKEQMDINKDLVGIVKMLKDLLIATVRKGARHV